MKLQEYPIFTIIMRGYTYEQADAILQAMKGFEKSFAVEMTLNTKDALVSIEKLNHIYGDSIFIGAGTVRTIEEAKKAIQVGAKFLLGPHMFTKEMLFLAKEQNVLAIPAAMTPSEVNEMFENGADIVKIFPATAVSPKFFKDIQAPLGELPLMAVGGVNQKNAKEFLNNQASYLGLGSGLFNKEDINEQNVEGLANSLERLIDSVQ